MKVKIQIIVEAEDGGGEVVQEVAQWNRGALRPEQLGMTLAEAKQLLQGVQQAMVTQQVSEYITQQSTCSCCQKIRARKGRHEITFRTLFGKLTLSSPRFYECRCRNKGRVSSSPLAELLAERTAPELMYLEAKFAALMSYGLTVDLLGEILPIGSPINASAVYRRLHQVAGRLEGELGEDQFMFIEGCQQDWDKLPPPGPPISLGLDGGFVHAKDQKTSTEGWFEVIVGKSMAGGIKSKCFAFVNKYDTKPKRRVYEVLKSQGMTMNQRVLFLSDAGESLRDLQTYLNPEAEHVLDWFHLTMRLTVMGQTAKGLVKENQKMGEEAERTLKSIKGYLWNGNGYRALQRIEDLVDRLPVEDDVPDEALPFPHQEELSNKAEEFHKYITNNAKLIPNYAERRRYGERVATGFVKSTVNQVVSKRMVKRQQMRWSERGAHELLQVRTRVLNDDLLEAFGRWHPGMNVGSGQTDEKKAA